MQPVTGEYTKSFNKSCPVKVEVNKATIDEFVDYGHIMRKSDAEMAEAIYLYKALGDVIYNGPEEQLQQAVPQQQDQ